jgi:hypothetical protein
VSTAQLFLGIIFGSAGLGYAIYGRKQRALVPFISGVALMIFPYFVTNTTLIAVLGIGFCALPFIYKP